MVINFDELLIDSYAWHTAGCSLFKVYEIPKKNYTTQADCSAKCIAQGLQLAVPRSSSDYDCIINAAPSKHSTRLWSGLILTSKGLLDNQTGHPVMNLAASFFIGNFFGTHTMPPNFTASAKASSAHNCVFLHNGLYVEHDCAEKLEKGHCACEDAKGRWLVALD